MTVPYDFQATLPRAASAGHYRRRLRLAPPLQPGGGPPVPVRGVEFAARLRRDLPLIEEVSVTSPFGPTVLA